MMRWIPLSIPRRPHARFASRAWPFILSTCLAAGLLASLPAAATAQFRQHIVNDDTSGEENRFDPWIATLTGGDFLLVWDDNGAGHRDLLMRRFAASLAPAGEPVRVNDDTGIRDQFEHAISAAAGGRIGLAWLDERHGGTDVYAQVIDASSGLLVGPNRRLTTTAAASGLRDHPAVATDSRGWHFVVWEEGTFGLRRAMGQLLDAGGAAVGVPRFLAPETSQNIQRHPAIAPLPGGGWIVAWEETAGAVYQVRCRILGADGSPVEDAVLIHQEPVVDPALGPDPAILVRAEDILIAWTDNRAGTADLWGRWLDHEGTILTEPALLREQTDTSRDAFTHLAAGPGGGFAVSWFGENLNQEIPKFRLFGADRQPLTGDLVLTDQAEGVVARRGAIAGLAADGSWILAWSDDRSLAQQVYLRRASPLGLPVSDGRQAWSVPASASQFLPDVALLRDGRAAVAWGDLRNGSLNIFLRILGEDGRPDGQSIQVNTLPVVRRYSGPTNVNTYWPHRPAIASSPDGSFVITWVGIVGGGTPVIYGQLFDAEGQPVGDNFTVAGQGSQGEGQSDPRPAMGPDGSFAVAWRVQVIAGEQSNDEVLIRRFDRFGSPAPGAPINPVDQTARLVDQIGIHLAISPFGDMVAVWSDQRWGGWDIFRQRLSATGQPLEAANQQVNTDDDPWADQFNPAVATNGSSILTIWEDRPSTAGNIEAHLEVLETKENGSGGGAKSVLRFRVNDDHPVPGLKNPRAAMDSRGRFIIAWWDEREGVRYVWARRYDETGVPIGQAYSIIGGETRGIRQVVSVAVDTSAVQYAWSDARRDRGWDVYARRVDWLYGGESTPILLSEWTAESRPDGIVIRWEVPYGLELLPFRLWRDRVEGQPGFGPSVDAELVTPDWLLSAQSGRFEVIDRDAPAGEPLWYFLETAGPDGSDFNGPLAARRETAAPGTDGWRIGPVPFRDRLELMPPQNGIASAEVFDLDGRRVRALKRVAGHAPLVWDGCDAQGRTVPAGVYFVRLSGPSGGVVRRIVHLR